MAGLNDAYSWSYTGGFAKLRWMGPCVHGRTPRQLAAMFTKWLEDNPERWHELAPKLFYLRHLRALRGPRGPLSRGPRPPRKRRPARLCARQA